VAGVAPFVLPLSVIPAQAGIHFYPGDKENPNEAMETGKKANSILKNIHELENLHDNLVI